MKSKKASSRTRYFHYLVFRKDDLVGMKKREQKDIWNGLHDFYLVESPGPLTTEEIIVWEPLQPWLHALIVEEESAMYTHTLTHQQVQARFWHIRLAEGADITKLSQDLGVNFVEKAEANDLPKPILIDNYLKKRVFSLSL